MENVVQRLLMNVHGEYSKVQGISYTAYKIKKEINAPETNTIAKKGRVKSNRPDNLACSPKSISRVTGRAYITAINERYH